MNEDIVTEEVPVAEMTVGEILRNARTTGRRKREITTIAKQLCIREEFLTALEEGDYNAIPEPVYILGFARNYAMELGLDPDEIVAKIKREMGLMPECAAATDAAESAGEASVCGVASRDGAQAVMKKAWAFMRRHWMWFAGGTAALVIIVVGAVLAFGGAQEVEAPVEAAHVVAPVAADTEPQYKMTVRERFGTDNREDATVVLQATAESWVKVEDARGKTVFSRVLVPGDVYYVPAKGRHRATFGNAGGIDAWVDGKLAPKIGADHKRVADVVLSAESLMKSGK